MGQDSESQLWDRIEAALDRVERAANRPAAVIPAHPETPPVDDDLARRHEQLRREVAASLSDLDDLIAGLAG